MIPDIQESTGMIPTAKNSAEGSAASGINFFDHADIYAGGEAEIEYLLQT